MDDNTQNAPEGVLITPGDHAPLTIRYRPIAGRRTTLLFAVKVGGCIAGPLFTIGSAVFGFVESNYLIMLIMILGTILQLAVYGIVAWFVWSVFTFRFGEEELMVERSLLGYRRRKVFRQGEVRSVMQIRRPVGDERPSTTSISPDNIDQWNELPGSASQTAVIQESQGLYWNLVVVASNRFQVLSFQTIDISQWIGLVIAKWAGAPFETIVSAEQESIESL